MSKIKRLIGQLLFKCDKYYKWLLTGVFFLYSSSKIDKQTACISSKEAAIALLKRWVDVEPEENLDSIPNLIISGAARS